jgi:imidazolonepropionase-like amidohydrolase
MLRSLVSAAAVLILFPSAHAAEMRYTTLIMGNPAGVQTTTVQPDGSRDFTFEYNDRGRGPRLTSRMMLDADGVPTSVQTSGNDYLKAPVKETFSIRDGLARWQNDSENGQRKLDGKAFYLSIQSMPEEEALLAAALLKTPGHRMALLPEGEASIRRTSEMTVSHGGQSRRVISYEISGLGFTPGTVWLNPDNTWFASVSSWASFVPEGWEPVVAELLARQDAMEAQRTVEIARTLTRKPNGPLAIVNARLFDAETGKTIPDATVVVVGNRIQAVGTGKTVAIPAGAESIDARGRALLPGLWDMHVHVGPNDGVMHIAAGVTSVRDLANDNDALMAIRRNIEEGREIGPRILMRGFMDGRGPYAGPTRVFVDTQQEAQAAIDNYAKLGYEGIKIYSSIKPELVPTLIRLAHDKGMRISGHVPAQMTARQFVEMGADELQHINFVFLNFFPDVRDTRTPARFTEVAERAATLDLNSPQVRSFMQLLKEHGTVVDPTVNAFEELFANRPGAIAPGYTVVAPRLPPQVRRQLLAGGLPVPEGKDRRYQDSLQALLRMIKVLHDAGITLVPGTDSMAGFGLHRELELYEKAGIAAPEVLRMATIGAARVMKRDQELGSIASGKLADLVLVDGDPAQRVADIRHTSLVIKDGNIYEPAQLYKSIGVRGE